MKTNDPTSSKSSQELLRAFRDLIIEAPEEELPALAAALGEHSNSLAAKGKRAVDAALESARNESDKLQPTPQLSGATGKQVRPLQAGLMTLLILLRRRDNLDEHELAQLAKVDESEIRRIEFDQTFMPSPRTIYQLERTFKLPSGTLAKLSGAVHWSNDDLEDEVLKFAASAKSMGKLTTEEKKLLNSFVEFLASRT